ncbi:MAG: FlgD immunoglobulin-like domain containing protein [Candidatus Krumholzibacteriia bacterium]
MWKLLVIAVLVLLITFISHESPVSRDSDTAFRIPIPVGRPKPGHRPRPSDLPRRGAASSASVALASYDFEDGLGGADAQGWTAVDRTAQIDTFFHVDDFGGLGAPYVPLEGSQSLWCGTRGDTTTIGSSYPGYGDDWSQRFESVVFPTAGDVTLAYLIRYDSEPGYDSTFVEYKGASGEWRRVRSYGGTGSLLASVSIPRDSLGSQIQFRFRFESDPDYSDEDGLYDSDGAAVIDAITVSDSTGIIDLQDFESESPGARVTSDGDWRSTVGPAFGDFSALVDGSTVLQEDTLVTNNSHFWVFFNGSPDNYDCGGHPEQPAVPFTNNPGSTLLRDYLNNEIQSPWIDLGRDAGGLPLAAVPDSLRLEFDVYEDLPQDNLVGYSFRRRFIVGGLLTPWDHWGFVAFGDYKAWDRFQYRIPNEPGATHVQIGIDAWDVCSFWCGVFGTGACHSHAPLIDNVAVLALLNAGATVTNTGDSGPGSFRQAILDANAAPGTDWIVFDIPGPGPHTIAPLSWLPPITGSTIIDGYSQPGSVPNTAGPGLPGDAALQIELSGGGTGSLPAGLRLFANNSTVRGLAINGFVNGIEVSGDSCRVQGNYLGTDPTGTVAVPNTQYGVALGGSYNLVGGTAPSARNVISGNGDSGVFLGLVGFSNRVQGNFIGTGANGTQALGNGILGVRITSTSHMIGGTTVNRGNTIAYNQSGVVVFTFGLGNSILSNRIHSNVPVAPNSGLGIDLGNDGVTPNDPWDNDVGPNHLQNFPDLSSATAVGGGVTIAGVLDSKALTSFNIQFFASSQCDSLLHGEGETFIGQDTLVTNGVGLGNFNLTYPANFSGTHITATATNMATGSTSEFSPCIDFLNTLPGINVTVDPVDSTTGTTPVTVTFDSVSVGGTTTLVTSPAGPPASGSFTFGDSATYYTLATNCSYTDSIEICISYDETKIPGMESDLVLLHYDDLLPGWVDVTTSLDTLLNVICGKTDSFSPFVVALPSGPTGIGDTPRAPARFALYQNVPNPFNPTTAIVFDVPSGGAHVTLAVYDVAGRLVRTLVNEPTTAGTKRVTWDGRNRSGGRVASGVYFYRMRAGDFTRTRKMLLLK